MYFKKRRDIFYNSNLKKNLWRRSDGNLNEFSNNKRNSKASVLKEEVNLEVGRENKFVKNHKEEHSFYFMGPLLETTEKVGESIKDYGSSERLAAIASGSDASWSHGPLDTHALSTEYDSEKNSSYSTVSLLSEACRKYSNLNFEGRNSLNSSIEKEDEEMKINCRSWLGLDEIEKGNIFENDGSIKLKSSTSLEVKTSCSTCPKSDSNEVSSTSSISSSNENCLCEKGMLNRIFSDFKTQEKIKPRSQKKQQNEQGNFEKLTNIISEKNQCCRSRTRLLIKSKPHSQMCYDICDQKDVPRKRIRFKQTDSSDSKNKQLHSYIHKLCNLIKLEKANKGRLLKTILPSKYSQRKPPRFHHSRIKKIKKLSTEETLSEMMKEILQLGTRLREQEKNANSILNYRNFERLRNYCKCEKLEKDKCDCEEIEENSSAKENRKEATKEIKRNLKYRSSLIVNLKDRSEEFCWNEYPESSQEESSNNPKSSLSSVYRIGGGSNKVENSSRARKKLSKKDQAIEECSNLSESHSEKCSFLFWFLNQRRHGRNLQDTQNETLPDVCKNVAQDGNISEKLDHARKSRTSFNDNNVNLEVKDFLEDIMGNCGEIFCERIWDCVDVETQTAFESVSEIDSIDTNSINTLWSCDADKPKEYRSLESLISFFGNELPCSLESISDSSSGNDENGPCTSFSRTGKIAKE